MDNSQPWIQGTGQSILLLGLKISSPPFQAFHHVSFQTLNTFKVNEFQISLIFIPLSLSDTLAKDSLSCAMMGTVWEEQIEF